LCLECVGQFACLGLADAAEIEDEEAREEDGDELVHGMGDFFVVCVWCVVCVGCLRGHPVFSVMLT
jgi:hypothetical protein